MPPPDRQVPRTPQEPRGSPEPGGSPEPRGSRGTALAGRFRGWPDVAASVGVVWLAWVILWPLRGGYPPTCGDHPVHVFKAWHFWEVLLGSGRLAGWSDSLFYGYPAEELYPVGADLWVAAFRLLTPGAPWTTTYAYAFMGCFAFCAWALLRFGRTAVGLPAALLGAVLWLFDPGDRQAGGWEHMVIYGVWAQPLAQAWLLLALVRLQAFLDRGRRRDLGLGAILWALCLVTHPMCFALTCLVLPLLLASRVVVLRRPWRRELGRALGFGTLGLLLAAFWVLPMIAHWSWTTGSGNTARGLEDIWTPLLAGRLYRSWPWLLPVGLVGGLWGVRRRNAGAVFLLLLVGTLLVLSTSWPYEIFALNERFPIVDKIQFRRFSGFLKLGLFLLCPYALIRAGRWMVEAAKPPPSRRQVLLLAPALLLLGVYGSFGLWGRDLVRGWQWRSGNLPATAVTPWWPDFVDAARWLGARAREEGTFQRVALYAGTDDHRLAALPVFSALPIYKVGFMPARQFRQVTREFSADALRTLSVRYVIGRRLLVQPWLQYETSFGPFHIHRFTGYRSRRYEVHGTATVEVLAFHGEDIRLRIREARPGTRLRLMVAHYDRWQARINGTPVPIDPVPPFEGCRATVMELPVQNGTLTLTYRQLPVDRVARGMSAGGLTLLLGLGLGSVWRRRRGS